MMKIHTNKPILVTLARLIAILMLAFPSTAAGDNWPQAAGPNFNWKIEGRAPTEWSVVRNENITWRTTLPEGGQSAVTVWNDRAFLTCHKSLSSAEETKTSTDIVGYCFNVETGEILWEVPLPGSVAVGTAGIFSDATVFAPVTDGQHVWFFNRSGSIGCFDFDGHQVWIREYVPRNRHTNRQCEPILFENQIITVEVLDKTNGAKLKRHKPVPPGINARSVWTYLHGIDKRTGEVLWTESVGTVCHHTPMFGFLANGDPAIVHARGGAHQPLETPAGMSLTSLAKGQEGKTIWSASLPKIDPPFNSHWDTRHVYAFHGSDHVVLDTRTGAEVLRRNLNEDVTIWKRDLQKDDWVLHQNASVKAGRRHANTNQTNIVVGDWHYFLAHDMHAIGRTNVTTGEVEYLEVPIQVATNEQETKSLIWTRDKAVLINTTNSRGINIAPDKRASRTGWGHVSAASPTLVGRFLYFPLMTGTVFVIDTQAKELGPGALVAVNDLGKAGDTWTLSSFSYSDGRLFMRTMKEVICIQAEK